MSVKIRPYPDHDNTLDLRRMGSTVDVFAMTGGETVAWRTVPRADFIAAVESELDVTIIDNAGLPEVVVDRRWIEVSGQTFGTGDYGRDNARLNLLRYAAAVRYLETHPPVDEAQVEALAEMYEQAVDDSGVGSHEIHPAEVARRLLATGRIEVRDA